MFDLEVELGEATDPASKSSAKVPCGGVQDALQGLVIS